MKNIYYNLWDNYWRTYRINTEAAIQAALREVPGQVIKVELDIEYGILVYEVTIRTQTGIYEVKIDADTGKVLEIESEFD
ncbi:MAG: PepSY domain-containing protein [Clostridium argentinense]|uniref:PepSY domain-containing protein n=1 Tax=Clostridium faecium TaxID=2762223 RepID=A0ABR8YTG6_9CLOT|nr:MULTISPECIES: PepSY domain-containing protein [Clostridium]MBD8047549.1 PepSY domain-containing protein [Clostridium faecium]MBS5823687.1 PepSY domain-containing protein [Clostridium argentinense]MDU1348806.1 PepSY domain-containing protein [Clostridium argentinense]